MITQQKAAQIAELLRNAADTRTPIEPLTIQFPGLVDEDAYEIQWALAATHLKRGHRVIGYKIGLTSREAQKHFEVFKPDYGHLFENMATLDCSQVQRDTLIQPKIEGEIAFILGKDLQGPGVTTADALRAIDSVCGALEIIDSRIRDWKIKAIDTISDNGSSASFVLGPNHLPNGALDLSTVGMNLSRNGEVCITAAGAAVMGNPIHALVFLANELGSRNIGLRAGQVILSGSLGGMLPVNQNDFFSAEFYKLGRVCVTFK